MEGYRLNMSSKERRRLDTDETSFSSENIRVKRKVLYGVMREMDRTEVMARAV